MTEAYPLWRWTNLDKSNMRFWLDQFWARYYLDIDQDCLVFVPENMTLFPVLHSWDTENMSQYMRQMMARWFHGQASVPELPTFPIYIFDEDKNNEGNINIQVLDREAFQPLNKQIGWLNDNLVIHNKINIEDYVKDIAKDMNWMQLSKKVALVRKKREAAFMDEALVSNNKIADEFNQLTRILTEEIVRIKNESEISLDEIKKLSKQFSNLKTVFNDFQSTYTKIQSATKKSEKNADTAHSNFKRLVKGIKDQVLMAEMDQNSMDNNIHSTIRKLKNSRESLEETLENLW
jgi:hypothetical protein